MSVESAPAAGGHNSIRVEIASSVEQLVQVFALRATTFWEENKYPYDLAFDKNDFQATHFITYMGDEPIGAVRVRWFKDFAKLERTAFRTAYRNIPTIKILADFVFAHVARKGYTQVITHAAPLYARLWRTHFGFRAVNKAPAVYQGEKFVELIRQLDAPADVVDLSSDVTVLFRTEGSWDAPGKYEAAG
ncbi:MAG: hypothetical protein U1E93_01175 [Alphaproteobacteria bacterium]